MALERVFRENLDTSTTILGDDGSGRIRTVEVGRERRGDYQSLLAVEAEPLSGRRERDLDPARVGGRL